MTYNTIKFLYSYGGKILPRRTDGQLRYVGGFTRVLAVDRSLTFSELMAKFGESCGSTMNLRCKLPSEDLDVLISVTSDEDLACVIEEYNRVWLSTHQDLNLKIRAILSPLKLASSTSSAVSSVNSSSSLKSPPHKSPRVYSAHQQPPPSDLQFNGQISLHAARCTVELKNDGKTIRYHNCREQGRSQHSYLLRHSNHQLK